MASHRNHKFCNSDQEANRQRVNVLKRQPCMDCHNRFDPCQMDFDHRDGSRKRRAISQMLSWSLTAIIKEINKCDLVCSNCHRLRTKLRLASMAKVDKRHLRVKGALSH
jgi:hypothetical protein